MTYVANEVALTEFVKSFESGSFPGANWKHREHIALAACYLYEMPLEAATARIRSGIRAYNEAQGGKNSEDSGYHETLTVFWLLLINEELDHELSRVSAVCAMVARFASQRDLYRDYYSFDALKSKEARVQWIAPDSKTLKGSMALPQASSSTAR